MPETVSRPVEPLDGELLIGLGLGNGQHLPVAELGEFFQNIAKDYKQVNRGHQLILYKIIEGSLWTVFRDAEGLAAGVASIIKFGRTISKVFNAAGKKEAVIKQTIGARTITSLAKIAAESGSRVAFVHKSSVFRGEEISFTIEPAEAQIIQARISARKAKEPPAKRLQLDHGALGSELARLARSGGGVEALITIARILVTKGAGYLVEEIATQLEEDGQLEAARVLKSQLKSGSGRANPPLLT
jgi:hypothetical protein